MKIDQIIQKAVDNKRIHDTYLYMYARDDARRIQNETGRDMDISPLDFGEAPKYYKVNVEEFSKLTFDWHVDIEGPVYEVEPDWSVLDELINKYEK